MNRVVLIGSVAMLVSAVAYTYDISHPNLKDAYDDAGDAVRHVQAAQQANKGGDFGGHDAKAISLFEQAKNEVVEADKYSLAHQQKK